MTIINEIELKQIKQSDLPLVIGFFGTIHVKHSELLSKYHNFNVLTFKNIPNKISLYTDDERLDNISKFDPSNIYVLDLAKYNMTAKDFINKILCEINPSEILVGSDFVFGSDFKTWKELRSNFKVNTISYIKDISCTRIAGLLAEGDIETANDLSYIPYYYQGKWISGKKLGRKLGYPTINIAIDHPISVPENVYITKITIGHKTYNSISFLGNSETINSNEKLLETYILNTKIPSRLLFVPTVRNKVRVEFIKGIRSNRKFESLDALKKQIAKDVNIADNYFKENI